MGIANSGTIKTLTNSGTVSGGAGGAGLSIAVAGVGGAGMSNASAATIGTLTNAPGATIAGGNGGSGFTGGAGGAGIANSGAIMTLTNQGMIARRQWRHGLFGGKVRRRGDCKFGHDHDADQQGDD